MVVVRVAAVGLHRVSNIVREKEAQYIASVSLDDGIYSRHATVVDHKNQQSTLDLKM